MPSDEGVAAARQVVKGYCEWLSASGTVPTVVNVQARGVGSM
jgi:hypothetical protein